MIEDALNQVSNLVDRFQNNIEAYQSHAYNETQLRVEFIDPFFEAFGWDITNKAGFAEQYKDVIHEDAIKIAGATKAPDYCFRIGGVRKFFLETKKPSVDIKDQTSPAYQLRRYAWSAKLPLSILTNFEELAIYDCRFRPKPNDKPSTGRVRFYTYTQYLDSLEEIYNFLAKESVLKGSFDKFAESDKQKRGTTEVDAEFLKEIESWRDALAKNIAMKNPRLSVRELNFAVQLTIDRIIFLRMCEDRGIEPYGQIQALLNGINIYHRLREVFYHADGKYNSGLFDFRTDRLTPELKLDDKPLKEILTNLYYPESPYEFSVLGADILGHVYEQFLGKVIRLTEGHHAKVEEKPAVRKAGGVYYTPTYIVDYIVKNTLAKLCEGKSPRQISSLRILDPACGSGSFLLGAYQYLLDYHRDWYQKDGVNKHSKEIYQGFGGLWHLSIQEKKRILLNNIYGVDIDPQAVEVTKLSLLLKVLESENQDTLEKQMKLFKERALPDLESNIKCGNSLIGPDFYQGKQMSLLEPEEMYRINPFDWEKEFPEIIKGGGFDAVIGNPPWGADLSFPEKKYLMGRFLNVHMRTPDTFNYFLANAYSIGSEKAIIGMIIPNNFLFQHEYSKARNYFVEQAWLFKALNLGDKVFAVTAPSCIVIIMKRKIKILQKQTQIGDLRNVDRDLLPIYLNKENLESVEAQDILKAPDCIISMNKRATSLISRILEKIPLLLGEVCEEIAAGIGTGGDKVFRLEDNKAKAAMIEKDILHPVLIGRDIHAYFVPDKTGYSIIYSTKGISSKTHPNTLKYLKPFQGKLSQKRETKKGLIPWWSLHWPRYPGLFDAPKIILRQTANTLYAALDNHGYYCLNSIIIIRPKDLQFINYYLGLLNSRLLRWLYTNFTQEQNRTFAEVKPINLRKLPIRPIKISDPADKNLYDNIVQLVQSMLSLNKQIQEPKTAHERTILERQIEVANLRIDQLVYELYGLTGKEIGIVEEKES